MRNPIRVLLVDDDTLARRTLSRLLQHLKAEVVAHGNPEEAMAEFCADPDSFDLVLSDQNMPEMPGHEMLEWMRAIRPELQVILCSGKPITTAPPNCFVLMKPFRLDDLAPILELARSTKKRTMRRNPV